MVKVLIPYALRSFTGRNAEVEVEGGTAGEVMRALAHAYPDLKPHLFTAEGALRGFINLFVGGENVNSLQGLDTPVADGGELMILPAIAGGLDVIGFYHSHPDHPAAPSEYDKDHALPFYSYVIVSVRQGVAGELTSWELTADRAVFLPENIVKECR